MMPSISTQSDFDRIKAILMGMGFDAKDIFPEASIRGKDGLRLDSLEVTQFVMNLEDEFDSEIPDEDMQKVATIGDVLVLVKE